MDEVLEGVLELIYASGFLMCWDDKDDILHPAAHPGLHHWHIGAALMAAAQTTHAIDVAKGLLEPSIEEAATVLLLH